jgi:hypothetical protein
MAAPNIVNVVTITGKTALANVTDSFANLVVNTAASGKVFKVNALYVTNVDGSANVEIDVGLVRSDYSYALANTIIVPADSTLDMISKSIYLEEGDYIQIKAASNNDIHSICSYEELS